MDAAAEAPEHLRELERDVRAAEHDEVLGKRVQFEDRGVVQERHGVDAVDLRHGRADAGVDEDALRRKRAGSARIEHDGDLMGAGELCGAFNQREVFGLCEPLVAAAA